MSWAFWTADYIRGNFNAGYEVDKCVCVFLGTSQGNLQLISIDRHCLMIHGFVDW